MERGTAGQRGRDEVIRLSDGRGLGTAHFGDREGTPVLFFHGFPGSRLEGMLLDEPAAAASVEDERRLAAIGLDQIGDTRAAVGGVCGGLVTHRIERGHGQLPAADPHGRGPGLSSVPLHSRGGRRDPGKRHLFHNSFTPPARGTEQAFY